MFAARCAAEGRTVLLTTRRITDLQVAPDRVTIAFTCWCGHEGVVVDHRTPARPVVARTEGPAAPPTTTSRPTGAPDRRAEPVPRRVPAPAAA